MTHPIQDRKRLVGRALILAGVGVWVVYAVVWLAGGEPQSRHYLPLHLCGVIPGAIMVRWDWIRRGLQRRRHRPHP